MSVNVQPINAAGINRPTDRADLAKTIVGLLLHAMNEVKRNGHLAGLIFEDSHGRRRVHVVTRNEADVIEQSMWTDIPGVGALRTSILDDLATSGFLLDSPSEVFDITVTLTNVQEPAVW